MVVIVAGSRECTDEALIEEAILAGLEQLQISPTKFIHGDATGVDKISGKICERLGYNVVKYPAKWKDTKGKDKKYIKTNKYGNYYTLAGFERNQKMADEADALIAINLGTNGTDDMVSRAKQKGLKVYEYRPNGDEPFNVNFWDE